MYRILPSEQLPDNIIPTPTDDLLNLYKICLHMENLCIEADGIGLSAVQIGLPWKLFVVRCSEQANFRYFINTEYESDAEKFKSIEGCLSLKKPNGYLRTFDVDRYKSILLNGQELIVSPDLHLTNIENEVANGMFGVVCQHEIDHHRLVLISDNGKEIEVW